MSQVGDWLSVPVLVPVVPVPPVAPEEPSEVEVVKVRSVSIIGGSTNGVRLDEPTSLRKKLALNGPAAPLTTLLFTVTVRTTDSVERPLLSTASTLRSCER